MDYQCYSKREDGFVKYQHKIIPCEGGFSMVRKTYDETGHCLSQFEGFTDLEPMVEYTIELLLEEGYTLDK